ncbi:hypothetical protein ANCCEY_15815, partial [Ancylostoma ceylanicum]
FMTVEEAEAGPNQLRFKLIRIGRISFSHDSAVRLMFREWTLLDEQHFESRLLMTTTVTRRLMEHTTVIYKKIYPPDKYSKEQNSVVIVDGLTLGVSPNFAGIVAVATIA